MLPLKNRLIRRKDFQNINANGKKVGNEILVLKWTENNKEFLRAGFIISKKVEKKAVLRNKLKRRLREIVRSLLPEMKTGFDLIFFAKKGATRKNYKEIRSAVLGLIKKANLFR